MKAPIHESETQVKTILKGTPILLFQELSTFSQHTPGELQAFQELTTPLPPPSLKTTYTSPLLFYSSSLLIGVAFWVELKAASDFRYSQILISILHSKNEI